VIDRLKYYDWTFSSTAEYAIGVLLAIAIVVTIV
jgi:hypothetical protein